ncbi:hypothetical protein [Actinomadura mexicana]|uniref:Pput_2613-like deaminase n=1 Tax=Actinomadura mexicana TaxID=134959 RepID=A0A238XFK5_9ACTN|nr:hypothetical protein [Actinomadura mexicana]SNR57796.1 Pput_2613-like deaminase [Actinomadura mexicana]
MEAEGLHNLRVLILDEKGKILRTKTFKSGFHDLTSKQIEQGFPKAMQAAHTEPKAYRHFRSYVRPGYSVVMIGDYAACNVCKGTMNKWYRESGGRITIVYNAPGEAVWQSNGGRTWLRYLRSSRR